MDAKQIDLITAEVTKFFDIDEAALFNLKVDNGISYLKQYFAHDPSLIDPLKNHAEFWLWWRELWAQRDLKILQSCEKKAWGFLHRIAVGKTIKLENGGEFTPTDTVKIVHQDVWTFYNAYHHPRNVKFFPNYILINKCVAQVKVNERKPVKQ
jgi:hypothetical protein